MFAEPLVSNLEMGFPTVTVQYGTIMYAVLSVVLTAASLASARVTFKRRLVGLKGSNHLLLLISVALAATEAVYLGTAFEIFNVALEMLASIGVVFAIIGFALKNLLKNIVAGVGVYMNRQINIGDVLEIGGSRGVITEFSITKILARADDGTLLLIPNLKMDEEVAAIRPHRMDGTAQHAENAHHGPAVPN